MPLLVLPRSKRAPFHCSGQLQCRRPHFSRITRSTSINSCGRNSGSPAPISGRLRWCRRRNWTAPPFIMPLRVVRDSPTALPFFLSTANRLKFEGILEPFCKTTSAHARGFQSFFEEGGINRTSSSTIRTACSQPVTHSKPKHYLSLSKSHRKAMKTSVTVPKDEIKNCDAEYAHTSLCTA